MNLNSILSIGLKKEYFYSEIRMNKDGIYSVSLFKSQSGRMPFVEIDFVLNTINIHSDDTGISREVVINFNEDNEIFLILSKEL